MAYYLFAAPVADVSGGWQDIAVFFAFGVIGAFVAWSLFSFVGVLSQDERGIFRDIGWGRSGGIGREPAA